MHRRDPVNVAAEKMAERELRMPRHKEVKREEAMKKQLGDDYVKMGINSGLDAMGMLAADFLTSQYISLTCPITKELMQDPVHTTDGHVFERHAIEDWFKRSNTTSPMTGEPLFYSLLTPAPLARSAKTQFLDTARQFSRLCKEHVAKRAAWICDCTCLNHITSNLCMQCGSARLTEKMNLE